MFLCSYLSHRYNNIEQIYLSSTMGNQLFIRAMDALIQAIKKQVFPLINANLKPSAAKILKQRIYFAIQSFRETGDQIKLVQNINSDQTQGDLKKSLGFLGAIVKSRLVFHAKRTQIDKVTYLESYLGLHTKGPMCSSWMIAVDTQVRVRVSL